MGLADDLESNLDELYQEAVRTNADDAFAVAIAATVRRVVGRSGPVLRIRPSQQQPIAAAGEPAGTSIAPQVGAGMQAP